MTKERVRDWKDLLALTPVMPALHLTNARLAGIEANERWSSKFNTPVGGWRASPLEISSDPYVLDCTQNTPFSKAEIAQWNFAHKTKGPESLKHSVLQQKIFVRGGGIWTMRIPLSSGDIVLKDVQLSLRQNLVTGLGANPGINVPVFEFQGSFRGSFSLDLSFKTFSSVNLALRAIDNDENFSIFGLECITVE